MLKKIIKGLITNPVLIFLYWLSFYELAHMSRYGGETSRYIIMFSSVIAYIIIAAIQIVLITKKHMDIPIGAIWLSLCLVIICGITGFYGYKIYKDSSDYGTRLFWFLDDLKHVNKADFTDDNLYKDGISGILKDIDNKCSLPKQLYLSDTFKIEFSKDGRVNTIDALIYGRDDKGEDKSFLIYYDRNKSKYINIETGRYTNCTYSDDYLLEPFVETISALSLQSAVLNWSEENDFGVLYCGKRNWGFNDEGIVFIDENGKNIGVTPSDNGIIGYTVSVYVPGKEDKYTPLRYNLKNDELWSKSTDIPEEEKVINSGEEENTDTCMKGDKGYRLDIVNATLGTYYYSLSSTTDGGNTWSMLNEDPFNGEGGGAAGITFIDDNVGFIALSHNGGDSAEIFRSDDGGVTFTKVQLPESAETQYFDFPSMPKEKDGILMMEVGQGADGDYEGNCKGVFQSEDRGITWRFIRTEK